MNEITLTNEIYRASKAPEVNALGNIAEMDERISKAQELDAHGFVIDRQIDLWRWDPVLVMVNRQQLGYSWVPNAFQPNLVDPLFHSLPDSTDMTKPWDRSILVSTKAQDYPSISTKPQPPVVKPVGDFIGNGMFAANRQAVQSTDGRWLFLDGQAVKQDGKTYIFHKDEGLLGASVWFTEAA